MKIFTKYALAAALVIPSVFGLTGRNAEAASAVLNKNAANGVNVRSEAKLGDNIIGLIDDQDVYEIKNEKDGWFEIEFDGKKAFVSSDLFHLLEETEVVSATNFRSEDNLNSDVIEVLDAGKKVEAIDVAENGFVKVKVDDKEGFIHYSLLKSFRDRQDVYAQVNQTQASTNNNVKANNYQAQTNYYQAPAQNTQSQAPAQNTNESYQGSSNWAKEWIAQRESGGSYQAYNPRGGYYGRYQLNPSLISYGASPAEQEAAADNYVAQRYGSWENAQAFWQRNGWY